MKLTVQELFDSHGELLGLTPTKANQGMDRVVKVSHVQRPGLSLAGYVKRKQDNRVLLFGRGELDYLKDLNPTMRKKRLLGVITSENPVVIVTRKLTPPPELMKICQELKVPLFRTEMRSIPLMTKLTVLLNEAFSPVLSLHGTLVEAFGIGVLIKGDSSIGKSEAALGLIERGHRLISDDVVKVRKKEEVRLIGTGPELNRHLIEIRGIGIINVANLYGAVCVRKEVQIDMVMHLEEWNEDHYYDRIGLEERFIEFLDINVPLYVHPVKPGRDIVLLIETTVLNHHLKEMGYHSAKEFNIKLLEEIAKGRKIGGKA